MAVGPKLRSLPEGRVELESEAEKTRHALECVPDGKHDWKPHDRSMRGSQQRREPETSSATLLAGLETSIAAARQVPALYGPSADERRF